MAVLSLGRSWGHQWLWPHLRTAIAWLGETGGAPATRAHGWLWGDGDGCLTDARQQAVVDKGGLHGTEQTWRTLARPCSSLAAASAVGTGWCGEAHGRLRSGGAEEARGEVKLCAARGKRPW